MLLYDRSQRAVTDTSRSHQFRRSPAGSSTEEIRALQQRNDFSLQWSGPAIWSFVGLATVAVSIECVPIATTAAKPPYTLHGHSDPPSFLLGFSLRTKSSCCIFRPFAGRVNIRRPQLWLGATTTTGISLVQNRRLCITPLPEGSWIVLLLLKGRDGPSTCEHGKNWLAIKTVREWANKKGLLPQGPCSHQHLVSAVVAMDAAEEQAGEPWSYGEFGRGNKVRRNVLCCKATYAAQAAEHAVAVFVFRSVVSQKLMGSVDGLDPKSSNRQSWADRLGGILTALRTNEEKLLHPIAAAAKHWCASHLENTRGNVCS